MDWSHAVLYLYCAHACSYCAMFSSLLRFLRKPIYNSIPVKLKVLTLFKIENTEDRKYSVVLNHATVLWLTLTVLVD